MRTIAIGVSVTLGMWALTANGAAADGKEIYAKNCGGCHAAMSPKLGDKKAWGPLLPKGSDALTAAVVKGKGAMPPKGGKSALSNADIKAAVDYMIAQVK